MSSSAEVIKKLKKDYGTGIASAGDAEFVDTPRLPTGIFQFDLASGGGFPMGRVSLVYGSESSNKTNICLKALGQGQLIYPDKQAVFVDAEGSYDPKWAAHMGVDVSKLIVLHPEYAEQCADMIEAFLYASDVFCVVLDSIAALSTQNEIESSLEKAAVGGAALLVNRLMKKTTVSFNRLRNQGVMPPAFIAINQIRFKIGGSTHSNPETLPGGNAQKYASSFTVRSYGKDENDKKISTTMPSHKFTSIIIKKWKMPILANNVEFSMQMLEGGGQMPGHIADWNTISAYLKELDYLSKGDKGGWDMFGNNYKTLDECKGALYADPQLLIDCKSTIISELLNKGDMTSSGEVEVEDEL